MYSTDAGKMISYYNYLQMSVPMPILTLTLSTPAKKAGGDKYAAVFNTVPAAPSRVRYIYVPQAHSRGSGSEPTKVLQTYITNTCQSAASYTFKLFKQAKGSGDDRYTPTPADMWTGDIYLPSEFRSEGEHVYLTFM